VPAGIKLGLPKSSGLIRKPYVSISAINSIMGLDGAVISWWRLCVFERLVVAHAHCNYFAELDLSPSRRPARGTEEAKGSSSLHRSSPQENPLAQSGDHRLPSWVNDRAFSLAAATAMAG
jgi:hypothetical protein